MNWYKGAKWGYLDRMLPLYHGFPHIDLTDDLLRPWAAEEEAFMRVKLELEEKKAQASLNINTARAGHVAQKGKMPFLAPLLPSYSAFPSPPPHPSLPALLRP